MLRRRPAQNFHFSRALMRRDRVTIQVRYPTHTSALHCMQLRAMAWSEVQIALQLQWL